MTHSIKLIGLVESKEWKHYAWDIKINKENFQPQQCRDPHRQRICSPRHHGLDSQLEETRLEDGARQAGEEHRSVATAGCPGCQAPGAMALGARPHRRPGQRARRRAGQPRRGVVARWLTPVSGGPPVGLARPLALHSPVTVTD